MFWYFHATLFWSLSKDACGFVQWMCIACARYDSSTPRGPPMDIRPRAGLKSVVDVFGIFDLTALASFQSGIFWRIWHVDTTEDAGFPSIRRSWAAGRMGCADRTRAGQTCAFTDLLIKSYQIASVNKTELQRLTVHSHQALIFRSWKHSKMDNWMKR